MSKGYRQSIERWMLGFVVRNGEMLFANDVRQDPNYIAVEGLATQFEICIPIFVEGEIAGVLNVEGDAMGASGSWAGAR